jgi:hypothetical protein
MRSRVALAVLCSTLLLLCHANLGEATTNPPESRERYPGLVEPAGTSFPVFASSGTEDRARAIASRCDRAHRFFRNTFEQPAEVVILVLAPEHWEKFADYPDYGMPHCTDARTLVVAGQENEMWKAIVPPLEVFPPDGAEALRRVYGQPDGAVSVGAFMDLLALHEMMHLFIDQTSGTSDFHVPRRWVIELLCNLGLHAYVVNEEPGAQEELTAFPQAIVSLGHDHLAHTSLADFERVYAGMEPPNFAWYQCQLHVAAHRVCDAGGIEALRAMFRTVVGFDGDVSDEQLDVVLREDVHPSVEGVLTA